jgi:hypothetical protein
MARPMPRLAPVTMAMGVEEGVGVFMILRGCGVRG